jgi:hypothetical protein
MSETTAHLALVEFLDRHAARLPNDEQRRRER